MRPGELTHRITLKRAVSVRSTTGMAKTSYDHLADARASRKTLNGDERYLSNRIRETAQVEFYTYPRRDLVVGDRVEEIENGQLKTFEILAVLFTPENGRATACRIITKLIEVVK